MKCIARICLSVFVLLTMLTGVAQAKAVVELQLNLINPPGHQRNEHFMRPWIQDIFEKSGGTLKITPNYAASLAPANEAFAAARSGIADMSEGLVYAMPGVFPLTEMIMLPELGLGLSAVPYNRNLWKAYNTIPEVAAEWKDVKILFLHTATPTVLMMANKPINTVEDLNGLRIRISGATSVRIAEQLGFSPVSISMSDLYQSLERGVIDGTLMNVEQLISRRFGEVVRTITHVPFVTDAFFVAMNWDSWNSLSAEHQALLESMSGEYAVERIAKVWDGNDARGVAAFPNVQYITPPDAVLKRFAELMNPIKYEVADAYEARGLPGRRVLEVLMSK